MDFHYLQKELYDSIKNDSELFDFIQESALDGLWYWDLEHPEHEWMNRKFWSVLGYDSDEMPHSPSSWQTIINPKDYQLAWEKIQQSLADPTIPYEQIIEYTHKSGRPIFIKCYGKVRCNAEGKPIRMLGAHIDETETVYKEKELSKETDFLKTIYNTRSIYIVKTDLLGNYTYVNDYYLKFFGFDQKKMHRSVMDEIILEDREKVYYAAHYCIENPGKKRAIVFTKIIQGKLLTASWEFMGIADENGITKEILCIGYDITDQKMAELALVHTNEELSHTKVQLEKEKKQLAAALKEKKAVMDALDHGALVTLSNYDGIILDVNENFCKVSGYSKSELIGQNHRIINSGYHSKEDWAKMWRIIKSGHVWKGDVRNNAKDGSIFWVSTVNSPIFDENGEIIQFLSVRFDILEKKKTEELQIRLQ